MVYLPQRYTNWGINQNVLHNFEQNTQNKVKCIENRIKGMNKFISL